MKLRIMNTIRRDHPALIASVTPIVFWVIAGIIHLVNFISPLSEKYDVALWSFPVMAGILSAAGMPFCAFRVLRIWFVLRFGKAVEGRITMISWTRNRDYGTMEFEYFIGGNRFVKSTGIDRDLVTDGLRKNDSVELLVLEKMPGTVVIRTLFE